MNSQVPVEQNERERTMPSLGASIVVPSRGGVKRLPVLLAALSQQNTSDFEVIFVLDGDIDGSEQYLEAAAAALSQTLSTRTIVFPENRGRSAALNAGAEAASGTVIIRCDDDLEPAGNYVSGHIAHHLAQESGTIGIYQNIFPATRYAKAYGEAADHRFRADAFATPAESQWRYWAGNVSVTKAMHDEIGGYDEIYRGYGWEDVDFGYRLHRAGVPVRIARELTTRHHAAATTTAIRALRALHSGSARRVFESRHGESVLGRVMSPRNAWEYLVAAGASLATEGTLTVAGSGADTLAGFLPVGLSEKTIALIVESAGRAGTLHPDRARKAF